MNTIDFLERLKEQGMDKLAEGLVELSTRCVSISTKVAEDESISIGVSKMGGDPDLPSEVEWPTWNGVKLSFLAQFNLQEISHLMPNNELPKQGLLSVFYHPDQPTWGFDPKDEGSWRTYCFSDDSGLSRRQTPDLNSEHMDKPYNTCSLTFEVVESLPSLFSDQMDGLNLTESEFEQYGDLFEEFDNSPSHQIFGYPNIVQNPMELQCQLVSNGIYNGDGDSHEHPKFEELSKGVDDWCLLLQIDSDENASMMWGDMGRLYFWIRKDSLAKGLLEETWMILQCH